MLYLGLSVFSMQVALCVQRPCPFYLQHRGEGRAQKDQELQRHLLSENICCVGNPPIAKLPTHTTVGFILTEDGS